MARQQKYHGRDKKCIETIIINQIKTGYKKWFIIDIEDYLKKKNRKIGKK